LLYFVVFAPRLVLLNFLAFYHVFKRGRSRRRGIKIEKTGFVGKSRRVRLLPNLTALIGIFIISA